jgi:hypothetical protein
MKVVAVIAAVALVLALPAAALALGMETFGNAPAVKQPEWAAGVLDVVNLKSRVYSQWVNGNENFFYRGDAVALNEALRKFAAVKDDTRRLILLPGPGKAQTFGGKPVACDWRLHVPSGIYRAVTGKKHAELTVYINAAKPRGTPDRKQAAKWIAELDADSFATRQKAEDELRKLGYDARPFLREALKGRPGLEGRRRLERLLQDLPGFDVTALEIPKGLTLISVDDLLAEHFKGLKDANPHACAQAIGGLSTLAPYSDKVLPALTAMLKKDKNEYLRRVAAGCLGHVGAAARSALPALKVGLGDPDANVRTAFGAAIDRIEKARREPGEDDQVRRKLVIRRDINELKKAVGGK